MRNFLLLVIFMLPLAACTASVGTTPPATTVYSTTPAVSSTSYSTAPAVRTTTTRTYY